MQRLKPLLLIVCLAVAGCQTTTSPTIEEAADRPQIRQAFDPEPGSVPLSLSEALAIFSTACLQQTPDYTGSEAALSDLGFVKSTSRSRGGRRSYVHTQEAVAIWIYDPEPRGNDCIMTFESSSNTGELESSLEALNTSENEVWFTPPDGSDGINTAVVRAN